MYCKYFGLDSKPFSITPDPRFLFLSDRHREALAHLLYGIGESGGFVQLTGEVGTGKTTLCRALLEQLPETVDVALILNPKLNGLELVAAVCDELHVAYPRDTHSLKVLVDHLNHHLLRSHAAGRRTILIIDEAQNLSIEVLEQIRLLTNLETTQAKLLQIILIGQPEFQDMLARPELRQLAQRITARYHLGELDKDETRAYITHRLRVSGGHADLFSSAAINEVQRLSGGIPRLVNVICDRALLGAYVEEKRRVDRGILRRAAAEVRPDVQAARPRPAYWPGLAVVLLVALAAAWLVLGRGIEVPESTAEVTAEAPAAALPQSPSEAVIATPVVTAPAEKLPQAEASLTPAAAEPATPLIVDLGERLAAVASDSAELQAWTGLFKLWNATLLLNDDLQPCAQAFRQGLHCLLRSGNWTQLRSFDRPALLQLIAADGRRVPVLLHGLTDERARIEINGEMLELPLTAIEARWHGQFTLLWRVPIRGEVLRLGSRGVDVEWLRETLRRIDPLAAAAAGQPLIFDAALAEQVRQFQLRRQLDPDGVVGALTLIHQNSADPASGGPRLTERDS